MELLNKTFATESIEQKRGAGARVRRFVITSDALDRDNEVVLPQGMLVDDYLKNPQFLWAHKADQLPLGGCVGIERIDGGRRIVGDFEFAKHKFADEVFELYKAGFLRAVSVGFRALQAGPPTGEMLVRRPELGKCWRVIMVSKLYEVSGVPIPSNPEALNEAVTKGLRVSPEVRGVIGGTADDAPGPLGRTIHWIGVKLGWTPERVARLTLKEAAGLMAAVGTVPDPTKPLDAHGEPARKPADKDDDRAEGMMRCPSCKGSRCPKCGMTGQVRKGERCVDCKGAECEKCGGAGYLPKAEGEPTRQPADEDADTSLPTMPARKKGVASTPILESAPPVATLELRSVDARVAEVIALVNSPEYTKARDDAIAEAVRATLAAHGRAGQPRGAALGLRDLDALADRLVSAFSTVLSRPHRS